MSSQLNPRKRRRSRSPSPSPGANTDESEVSYDEIPHEFFCPISNKFMSDPVKIPTFNLTYDRNSIKDSHKPEDVKPDFRMRNAIEEWFSCCDLDPPFNFVSNLDELMLATNSVMEQRAPDLLNELATEMKSKPWLLNDGGGISCVAMLLSFPHPSASWVVRTLSIVAHVDHDSESLIAPADIHSDYSLLDPIARACADSACEDEEFQSGLINLMYALVADSPDTSAMAGKLGGIIDALVSYVWPVEEHLVGCYIKLLATVEILSTDMEISEQLFNAGVMGLLFFLLEFAVSSGQEIISNPDKLLALMAMGPEEDTARFTAIKYSFKILDTLCSTCQVACSRIEGMNEGERSMMERALIESAQHVQSPMGTYIRTYMAGSRVLGRYYLRIDGSRSRV